MIIGQIIVYKFNNLTNAKESFPRNVYSLRDVSVKTGEEFRRIISFALDEFAPKDGYILVKWNNKMFICEKDTNNPDKDYVRHELTYHPLESMFTI